MRKARVLLALVALVVSVAACPRDDTGAEAPAGTAAAAGDPIQEMQATLTQLAEAQTRYFDDHQRYSADLAILVDQYGFQPVGDATATISFAGTTPQWGYLATAVHAFSTAECELLHGQAGPQGPPFSGQIQCEGA